jgi:hypothetical protein
LGVQVRWRFAVLFSRVAADEPWPVVQEVDEYLPLNTHLQTAVDSRSSLLLCPPQPDIAGRGIELQIVLAASDHSLRRLSKIIAGLLR